MKLAEALILRADRQKRLEQLRQRLIRSAKVQEGDEPPEDPWALLKELEGLSAELTDLIQRINRTNSRSEMPGGTSLTDALARRDVLGKKQAIYRDLAQAAVVTQDRTEGPPSPHPPDRERVVKALDELAEEDVGDVKRLKHKKPPQWRLRVGPWRVRFTYRVEEGEILVLRVLPRGKAYDR